MLHTANRYFILAALLLSGGFGCSTGEAPKNTSAPSENVASASEPAKTGAAPETRPAATPAANFTPADVAKLKWIEGTWRGMDLDKPFYERYKLEPTALVVESLNEDGAVDGTPERFELKNGEFGKGEGDKRSAASEITDSYIQFVPALSNTVGSQRNSFKFERESAVNWKATLEWPASPDKPARQKVYKMEAWTPQK